MVEGQLGQPGAVLEISTSATQLDATGAPAGAVQVWLRATDTAGVAQWGYGPSGFFPQWILPSQRSTITGRFGSSVGDYLAASGDPMTDQGSYYYTSPFLQVAAFSISENGAVVASGASGELLADYVTQSFDEAAKKIVDGGVTWLEFSTQLDHGAAFKIGKVSQSSVGDLPYAIRVEPDGQRLVNGSLRASASWAIDGIKFESDPSSMWSSPRSHQNYATRWTVTLSGTAGSGELSYKAVYDDQELDVAGRAVYEGLFEVSGTVDGQAVHGFA